MRSRFDEQLSNLSKELTTMGAMCEEIIALTSKALSDGDKTLLSKVFPIANDIDRMERTIRGSLSAASFTAAAGSTRFKTDIGGS